MKRALPILLLLLPTALPAATRLPANVVPEHYAIRIATELGPETFHGEETIDVRATESVSEIVMHSVDMTLTDVTVNGAKAEVTADKENETVALKLAQPLAAGPAKIHINFEGKILPRLNGLYLSRTVKRKYAVTQFEAMSARRAFPCFDEPAMKATFDVTLVVDSGDMAISNGRVIKDEPAGEGKHAVTFSRTPKLPTYLLAFLVGDFQCISGEAEGTPIRVCTTPGLQHLGKFALEASKASLKYFNEYYGIRYPFEKMDLVGIPDFGAGAMENAGAITFRETDLLVDEQQSSTLAQKRVAMVVAHEIAHQWFGDLVTMKWWNDIWLNEGFATFMSTKPIEAWKPEWHSDLDKPVETDDALTVDGQRSTRPIRMPVNGSESGSLFDPGIVYNKTAAVLRMAEEWAGKEAFRDAIRVYLKKYSWSNAAAEDFLATIKGPAKQPVDTVIQSFIDITGAPLLRVNEQCEVAQERLLPKTEAPVKQAWTIPICTNGQPCRVITGDTKLASCNTFLERNGTGYYAVDYPASTREMFRKKLKDFQPAERISYRGNEWLLVREMRRDAGEYLGLLQAMPRPSERQIVTEAVESLVFLDQRLVDDHNRDAWRAYVRKTVNGLAPATWDAPKGETSEQRISRSYVLWALGYLAADADVIAGAKKTAAAYMKDPTSVDALIADRALRIAAVHGDDAFLTSVLEQLGKASTPELSARYRNLLPLFRDAKASAHAYDYIYSDRIRAQDLGQVASPGFSDPATRSAAWAAAKTHWTDLEQRAPGALGRLTFAAGGFCDAASRAEVEAYLKEHKANARGLSRALDAIDTCIAFKAAQQASFDAGVK
ncbi:MAG: M1 family metallopeptidase [Acidobacteria bacterium]|nr:M1 family metallopeptidase [Acidobacteriota bacterium]